MTCPPEIAEVLCGLLRFGLLQIRGGVASVERMRDEADHLHNLPGLLVEFHPNLLCYYWDTERPCYLRSLGSAHASQNLKELWDQLEPHIHAIRGKLDRTNPDDTR